LWPDDKVQIFRDLKVNQLLVADHANATKQVISKTEATPTLLQRIDAGKISHEENDFNEFDRDRLLYHMLSTAGPAFAKADLNGDGIDDFYLGASVGSRPQLYLG